MIVVDNPRADRPVPVPVHDDGTPYRYEMIFDDARRRAYADTYTELVAALIAGYGDLQDSVAADEARLLHAVRIQVELQAQLCVGADLDSLSDRARAVLLGSRDQPPPVGLWRSEIPLVLVESYYQPTGELNRPISRLGNTKDEPGTDDERLIWLDPTDEANHIQSLAAAGVVIVSEHEDAD